MERTALVRQAAGGDTEAFGRLVHEYRTLVYGICLSWAHQPAEAEDLTQEVFDTGPALAQEPRGTHSSLPRGVLRGRDCRSARGARGNGEEPVARGAGPGKTASPFSDGGAAVRAELV